MHECLRANCCQSNLWIQYSERPMGTRLGLRYSLLWWAGAHTQCCWWCEVCSWGQWATRTIQQQRTVCLHVQVRRVRGEGVEGWVREQLEEWGWGVRILASCMKISLGIQERGMCIQSVVLQVSVHVLQDGSCGNCEYFAVQWLGQWLLWERTVQCAGQEHTGARSETQFCDYITKMKEWSWPGVILTHCSQSSSKGTFCFEFFRGCVIKSEINVRSLEKTG